MNIVDGKLDDISVIADIAQQTWYVTYKNILTINQIDYMLEMMYSNNALTEQMTKLNHHFLLIKDEPTNSYVGFVSYELNYKNSLKTKLHKLYVLPNYHGKGLGRILINAVMEKARHNKNEIVTLNVNRNNNAKSFYEYIGFTISGKEDIDIGNGFLMEDYILDIKV